MYPCSWGLLVPERGFWAGSVWLWRGCWDAAFPSLCCGSLISCVLPGAPTYRGETWLAFDQCVTLSKSLVMWKGCFHCAVFYYCFEWILISFVLDRSEWGKAKSTTKKGKGRAVQVSQSCTSQSTGVRQLQMVEHCEQVSFPPPSSPRDLCELE